MLVTLHVIACTCVRPDTQSHTVAEASFWMILVCLVVIMLVAADERWLRAMDHIQASRLIEAFEDAVKQPVADALTTIPWKVYGSLAPTLERLTGTIRGDAGDVDSKTTDLTVAIYRSDPLLQGEDGKLDQAKFDAMRLQYKQIVVFLCRMKGLAPSAHDTLVKALGGC